MKPFRIIITVILACLAAVSCGTMQVATKVFKQCPVIASPENVVVYENGVPVPSEAEVLGEVSVYDKGNAKTEPWDTTLFRAKTAVSQVGGNGLYILDHVEPSMRMGTNHQIYGTMLLCREGSVAEADNPLSASFKQYAAQKKEYEDQKLKGSSVRVSAGYSRIISELDRNGMNEINGNIRNGFEVEVGYEYILPAGLGLGVTGSMFKSSAELGTANSAQGRLDLYFKSVLGTVSYVTSTEKLIFNTCVGIGYAVKSENWAANKTLGSVQSDDERGVGMNFSVDFSYRFSLKTSLGLLLNAKTYSFGVYDDGRTNGFKTLGVGLIFRQTF